MTSSCFCFSHGSWVDSLCLQDTPSVTPARRSLSSRGPTQDPSSAPARGPAQTSLPAGGREGREAPPERPWELRSLVAQELVLPGGKPRVGASPCRVCSDRVAAPVRARSPVRVVSPSAGHAPGTRVHTEGRVLRAPAVFFCLRPGCSRCLLSVRCQEPALGTGPCHLDESFASPWP